MMRVAPKSLIRRLTSPATRALEAAVGRAVSAQAYEVGFEYVLLALIEADDGEASRLLQAFDQDRVRLSARVTRVLEQQRSGNPGRPVFSESVFRWFEDAWLIASLELEHIKLRSG